MSTLASSPIRRGVLAASATAQSGAAAEDTAIRPFTYHAPQADLDRAPPAHRRHALAGQGDRRGLVPGRATRDDPETRSLLGDRL